VTSASLKSFEVSWNTVSNAVAYTLKIYALNGTTLLETITGLSGTSKLVNGAAFPAIMDGTTYKIGVTATGDVNNADSALSALASVITNSQYTITYNSNFSTEGTAPAAATFITGSDPYLISANTGTLARTSFSFSGWNTDAEGNGTTYLATGLVSVSPTSNLVLYPKWTANPYLVTYSGNGGSSTLESATYVLGSNPLLLPTATRENFTFQGWYDAATDGVLIGLAGLVSFGTSVACESDVSFGRLSASWSVGQSVGWSVEQSIGSLLGNGLDLLPVGVLVGGFIGWLVG
jgi:hypothetical protein